MMFSRVRLVLFFAALRFVLIAPPAHAEAAAAAPLAQSLTGEAKAAYDAGRRLFDGGDSAGALAKFSRSYDSSHDARLLWNMAACEKELHHYASAATFVGRYLREGGNRLSLEQQQSALNTQNALHAFCVTVKLRGAPDGATVLVDGTPMGHTPLAEPLLVDLGAHTVRVEPPGFEASESKLEVASGGVLEVAVTLKRSSAAGTAASRLSVSSAGERDIVAIDGKVLGSQHWEGPLTSGEHTVRVTAAHKKPYESRLQLPAGSTRSLRVTLEDESPSSNIWLWVAGGAALTAGAALGGYFLLKPQDSPGTHPEGKLSTVYLSLGGAR